MNAIDKGEINNEEAESHNLYDLVCEIIKNWKSLLDSKKISIKLKKDGDINNCNITKSDLYLIINNFILNSSWFLKDIENRERKIEINFSLKDDVIKIRLYNNGKPMDDKYKKNPLKMFELGESTKVLDNGELGTGIGMWLIKTAVEDNKGTVLPVIVDVGFELEICFPQS
ncbi:GHKL domain-containing protein [Thomasclavelia ramosa]|uniref:GHKL domain-containing protein n=1 Tax=Thomasclavelia ramosa TaxID=1547 RepID=UPI0022E7F904|nr:GHKL domain-containing protein [Thomasclavelia ramosa]